MESAAVMRNKTTGYKLYYNKLFDNSKLYVDDEKSQEFIIAKFHTNLWNNSAWVIQEIFYFPLLKQMFGQYIDITDLH